jgi:DNA-binding transcriptional LysR family regulator
MTALDDLRLLRSFVRIAESGSISAAARAMNLPQPTVSRQLRQLEQASGVVLIRRDTHALSLTAAGHRLLEDARELLDLAAAASERVREETSAARGHLRIVAVLDTGQWIVPHLLAGFRKTQPQITVELHLTNRPSRFIEEGFDCGILVGTITDPSVASRKAGELRRLLVGAPSLLAEYGVPKEPEDLKRFPWMGILQPHFYARDRVELTRGSAHRTVRLTPILVMDSVTALREAAIAGAGITIEPEWLVGEALQKKQLVRLLPQWKLAPVDVHVVFPTGRPPTALRAFVDFAAAALPALFEESQRLTLNR